MLYRTIPCCLYLILLGTGCSTNSSVDASLDATDSDAQPCSLCGCATPENMVCVPEGSFLMGESDPGAPHETLHEVYLSSFLIDVYEVTNREYLECMYEDACDPPNDTSSYSRDAYLENPDYEDYPVIWVNWHNATQYCLWQGKRLPTEAEWEKAARGGCEARGDESVCEEEFDAPRFPWGDESAICETANAHIDCVGDTSAVGTYPLGETPYGVLDMIGNTQEWVSDWYNTTYFLSSPYMDPQGPNEEEAIGECDESLTLACRTLKGSYYGRPQGGSQPNEMPLSVRAAHLPVYSERYVSFRCARDLETTE